MAVAANLDLDSLPELGVGLGYRPLFCGELFLHAPKVDFLEIIAEHYLDMTAEKEAELSLLETHFTLIPHAICLSLGSADGIDPIYLDKLAHLIKRLNPPWWSEHICFSHAGGRDIGHLTPMPFTSEAVNCLVNNIAHVKARIDTPLILENIAYLVAWPNAEMSEAAFIRAVLERSDCGLLLDVMNLYANALNHGYEANAFLEQIPLERVVQLHFVGGHWHQETLIDSHSQTTHPEVWTLIQQILKKVRPKGLILERDTHIPPLRELLAELETARHMLQAQYTWV